MLNSPTQCPSCGAQVPAGGVFCDNCGYDLRNAGSAAPVAQPQQPMMPQQPMGGPAAGGGMVCPTCGYSNVGGARFCENCGGALGGQPQAVPQQQVPQPQYQQPVPPPQYPQQPQQPYPAAPQAPQGGMRCASCGAMNAPGGQFCENCGAPLGAGQQPYPPQGGQQPQSGYQQPMGGFVAGRLVVMPSNTSVSIPQGKAEVIIGREDPVSGVFPEVNLDPYGGHDAGVSRQHARLALQGGRLVVIDMNTANGTFVNKQKIAPNTPTPVNNGDELRFGRLVVMYYAS